MKITALTTTVKKILDDKTIVLPKFQRDFSWAPDKIQDLADSIKTNIPIGVLTIFKGDNPLLIDGQQRVTSLKIINKNLTKYGLSEKEFNNFEIIKQIYESDEDSDAITVFQKMNDGGTPLDAEDIHQAFLSMATVDKPDWITSKNANNIQKMYKVKNDKFYFAEAARTTGQSEQISILELFYFINLTIGSSITKNHDRYIISKLTKKTKNKPYKLKLELIWIKRILISIFAKNQDEYSIKNHAEHFDKQIQGWLESFTNTEETFKLFCKKIQIATEGFHTKFSFTSCPFSKSAIDKERKGIYTDLGLNKFITIYLLHFFKNNSSYIKDKDCSLENFQTHFQKYSVRLIDLIAFTSKSPISQGGVEKWYQIIFCEPETLFYNYDADTLVAYITDETKSKKTFQPIQKLVMYWIMNMEQKFEWQNNNGEESCYYEWDHTIPYADCKKFSQNTSIFNLSPIKSKDNRSKSCGLAIEYQEKDWVNTLMKVNNHQSYSKIIELVKDWNKLDNITEEKFSEYIEHRKTFLKSWITKKLKEEYK